jgi:hypothetical protein
MFLDYYLKAAPAGPVTLEVLDASGAVVSAFASESASAAGPGRGGRGGTGIPNTSALWRPAPEPFSTAPGLHRVIWNPPGGGGRGGRGTVAATSRFTARLTVNGRVLTQSFTVQPDPRAK